MLEAVLHLKLTVNTKSSVCVGDKQFCEKISQSWRLAYDLIVLCENDCSILWIRSKIVSIKNQSILDYI